MSKNIEINIKGSDGEYETLYPKVNSSNNIVSSNVLEKFGLGENGSVEDVLEKLSNSVLYSLQEEYTPHTIKFGDLSIGEKILLEVNNLPCEFIVIQQGKPSDSYDNSCDGTWLMINDVFTQQILGGSATGYFDGRNANTVLQDEIFPLLGEELQVAVQSVKLPSISPNGSISTFETKLFFLSLSEISYTQPSAIWREGSVLSYFNIQDDTERKNRLISKFHNQRINWWLRTCYSSSSNYYVGGSGTTDYMSVSAEAGCRFAMIVNSNVLYTYYLNSENEKHLFQHYLKIAFSPLKEVLGNLPKITTGEFIGTNTETAFINCGFTPQVVFVYTKDGMVGEAYGRYGGMGIYNKNAYYSYNSGGTAYTYKMIEIVENGLVVFYYLKIQGSSYYVGVNSGQKYYLAIG